MLSGMEIKDIRCKNCGAPIDQGNIVERLDMARCGHCGIVFALEKRGSNQQQPASTALRPRVPMPEKIELQELDNTLEIRRRWFGFAFIFLALFCLVWNGFMVAWHVMAWSTGAWFMSFFGLLHTAVGLGLLYFTIAGFLNTTTIRAGQGVLDVKSAPIPWPGNKSVPIVDVKQLYCSEKSHHGKNSSSYTYEVNAIRFNDAKETLVKGLTEADQALYIEQELERFLKIEDRPVRGEVSR